MPAVATSISGDATHANGKLNGKRVAILATDGVEQVELTEPRKGLDDAGATTTLISLKGGTIKAREIFQSGKPIAAICHGPWLLVEADVVRNRTFTSWSSLQMDVRNAGGDWVDREVATDMGLVTSRKPDDIPAFNNKMIEAFGEGIERRDAAAAGTSGARTKAAERDARLE